MNCTIIRRAVWLVAAAAFGYATFALIEVRPAEFLVAASIVVICIPVHLALGNEIRSSRVSPFGPVRRWGISEDAVHASSPRRPSSVRRWWERLTSPMMIAAMPLLLIPVGLLSSPSAEADPFTDRAYLATLDTFEVPYVGDAAVISLGHSICDALDRGVTADTIVATGMASGYTQTDVEHLLGAAVGAYCHEHWTAA